MCQHFEATKVDISVFLTEPRSGIIFNNNNNNILFIQVKNLFQQYKLLVSIKDLLINILLHAMN